MKKILRTEGFLIHASAGIKGLSHLRKSYKSELALQISNAGFRKYDEFPLGVIIGKVNLVETFSTNDVHLETIVNHNEELFGIAKNSDVYTYKNAIAKENAFGDYEENRFGWILNNPVQFKKLNPAKGQLKLWNYNEQICFKCGCTQNNACVSKAFGACWWHEKNICSHCAEGVNDLTLGRLGGRFNAAKPLLCSRCGLFSRNFNRSKVFLIFFCAVDKNIHTENQHFTNKITNK